MTYVHGSDRWCTTGEPTAYFVASENAHGKSDEGLNVPLELDDILSDAAKVSHLIPALIRFMLIFT